MRRTAGFTLIELMATILILAILLGVGVPSFSNYLANQRVRSGSELLVSALNFARSEAVKRGATISVEPVSGVWTNGWQVKNGTEVLADTAAVSGLTISASSSTLPEYQSNGRLTTSTDLKYTVSSTSGTATSACVQIKPSGKATLSRTGACP